MRTITQHATLGTIVYEENAWTGKKKIIINNVPLEKQSKKSFLFKNGEESKVVQMAGNFVSGTKIYIDNECIELTPAVKWYEVLCSVFIFLLNVIWGNNLVLCSIIPIVGGAIGGAVSGAMAFVNIVAMKSATNVGVKLAIWVAMIALMMLICFLLVFALVPLFV